MNKSILKLENVSKKFDDNVVLDDVTFELNRGEIHALIGENGAGKTTLIKILTGILRPEEGRILLDGEDIVKYNINGRIKKGISTVYQELDLCPNLTVVENIFLGSEYKKCGVLLSKKMKQEAIRILSDLGFDIDVNKKIEDYPISIRQIVAIARAIRFDPKVLVLDEPTSSLTNEESKKLFEVVLKLKEKGVSVIFITHFLHQVYELCDRVTILRDGKSCGTYDSYLSENDLLKKMLGKEIDELPNLKEKELNSETIVEIEKITDGNISPFNLEMKKGEIVGLAGVISSGTNDIVEMIYGKRPRNGIVKIDGAVIKSVDMSQSLRQGVAFVSKDRKEEGIVPGLSVLDNMMLALQKKNGINKKIHHKEAIKIAKEYIEKLNIKVYNLDDNIETLSGGNQQKVILSRFLLTKPKFLILEEPTRGIDVSSKIIIWDFILELAKSGMSVLIVSSEIEELIRLCNRILVVRDSKVVAQYNGDFDQDDIINAMLGDINEK